MGIWAQYGQLGRESLSTDSYGDYQVETLYYTPQASGLSYKAVSNPYLTGSGDDSRMDGHVLRHQRAHFGCAARRIGASDALGIERQ